jgi:transcriptional regulator of arginine metabolism
VVAKSKRQHHIARILERCAVGSQSELVGLLAKEGIVATQATVSRDLDELGAVKVRAPGGDSLYAIPEAPKSRITPSERLRKVLTDFVVEVAHSENIVVLKTPPGSAHVVGSALDSSRLDGLLGTVAGDDTVIVVASESKAGAVLASVIASLAGL